MANFISLKYVRTIHFRIIGFDYPGVSAITQVRDLSIKHGFGSHVQVQGENVEVPRQYIKGEGHCKFSKYSRAPNVQVNQFIFLKNTRTYAVFHRYKQKYEKRKPQLL